MMLKRIRNLIGDGITLVMGTLLALVAAPVIHLSGLDNTDSCPSPEDIERSNQFAEQLSGKRSK